MLKNAVGRHVPAVEHLGLLLANIMTSFLVKGAVLHGHSVWQGVRLNPKNGLEGFLQHKEPVGFILESMGSIV